MFKIEIDPNIRVGKLEEMIMRMPRVVVVNKFNEEAALKFNRELAEAKNSCQPVIPIIIDSYGGEVYSLLSMVDNIHSVGTTPVATIITGKSMSCGAVLFSQGTEGYRFMAPNATLMIHDVSSGNFGKTEEINANAKEVTRLNDLIYDLMAKGTGKKDPKYFWKLVHQKGRADWYLTAAEAKKHNLTNHLHIPSLNIKINYNVDFG